MLKMFLPFLMAAAVTAQTQVDLKSQARRVDFTSANWTRPIKTGTALPAACTLGDMYFKTDAPAGQNLYACTGPNTWSAQAGGGNLVFKLDDVVAGSRPVLNYVTGTGLFSVVTDTGSQIDAQLGLDTAVIQTVPGEQSGAALQCASASNSANTYLCAMSPRLLGYNPGMVVHWIPDRSGGGGSTTLNIDGLGAAPVRMADGTTDPAAGDIAAGRMYTLWYDGSRFRMPATFGSSSGAGAATRYAGAMSGTTVTITATTHGLGTTPTLVGCRDTAGTMYEPGAVSVNGSGDVTVTSATAMTGYCYITGSATGASQYVAAVTGTSVTITSATHGLGANPILGGCYDGSNNSYEPGAVSVDVAGDMTITSGSAMTGKCILR